MNERKPRLLIIRGLPGSAKSTLAKQLHEKYGIAWFENDQFLMQNDKYVWTPTTAKDAANKCFESAIKALKDGKDCIVSNVFVTAKSINRYVNAAKKLGAEVQVMRKTSQYKNVHDVPDNVFNSMKRQFEDYAGETLVA